jgi:pyruvate kinase
MHRTKARIIATVGPACAQQATLRRMIQEGVSVFRFNFSHGSRSSHQRTLDRIARAQRGTGRRVEILQDLAGPRIRTGRLARHRFVRLQPGQRFRLYWGSRPGGRRGVSLDYPGRFNAFRKGQMIYLADGGIHLQVVHAEPDAVETLVVQEGVLGERKGVNIPESSLDFPALSDKDARDLAFAVDNHVDYVAQSFVRSAQDVLEIKRRLAGRLPHCRVIAKIESRDGIRNIAAILKAADGIMIARGDLGISMPIHELPVLQKWIIAACNHLKKPVITATQMLEHMMDHPLPTRAEVSDVANAVIDGSNFVMLSGETAAGERPVEAVRMMRTIIEYTERNAPFEIVRRRR